MQMLRKAVGLWLFLVGRGLFMISAMNVTVASDPLTRLESMSIAALLSIQSSILLSSCSV